MDRVAGPISLPPRISFCSPAPIPGMYSSIPVQMVMAQKANWSHGSRYPVKLDPKTNRNIASPMIQLNCRGKSMAPLKNTLKK